MLESDLLWVAIRRVPQAPEPNLLITIQTKMAQPLVQPGEDCKVISARGQQPASTQTKQQGQQQPMLDNCPLPGVYTWIVISLPLIFVLVTCYMQNKLE